MPRSVGMQIAITNFYSLIMTPEEIKEIQRQSFARLAEGKGHGVQYQNFGEWIDVRTRADGSADISWTVPCEYRIRPDTVNVFGIELPAPEASGECSYGGYQFSSENIQKWYAFIRACMQGKYAQKKVTAEDVEREVKAYYESTPQFIAKKIFDLFESARNENK